MPLSLGGPPVIVWSRRAACFKYEMIRRRHGSELRCIGHPESKRRRLQCAGFTLRRCELFGSHTAIWCGAPPLASRMVCQANASTRVRMLQSRLRRGRRGAECLFPFLSLTHARAAFLSQVNGPEKQELLQLIGALVDETAYNQRVSATSPKRRRRVTPLDRWLRPNPFHGQTRAASATSPSPC